MKAKNIFKTLALVAVLVSADDKLFVGGFHTTAGRYTGILDYVSDGTFSGTITTENEYTGTVDDLFASAYQRLLPWSN